MSRGQYWLPWDINQRTECAKLSRDWRLKCDSGSSGKKKRGKGSSSGPKSSAEATQKSQFRGPPLRQGLRRSQYSKGSLLPLLVVRLLKKWPPRNWSCPRSPVQREGKGPWCQREGELVSQEEMSPSADSRSGHFAGDTGTPTMMDQRWEVPQIDLDPSDVHIISSLDIFKLSSLPGKWIWE